VLEKLLNELLKAKNMKFGEVLEALRNGERLVNSRLSGSGFICRMVPQCVDHKVITNMTSLPDGVKEFLKDRGDLRFHDQVLLFEWSPMQEAYIVTSYIPTWYDIFDETWTIC